MSEGLVIEYVELCEQIAATELLDQMRAEPELYDRLDQIWQELLSFEERDEVEDRLVAKARSWHDERRSRKEDS